MAQTKYTYSIAGDTLNAKLAADSLKEEIGSSAILTALDYISALGDVLDIYMKDALSGGDQTLLDGVVSVHAGVQLAGEPNQVVIAEKDGDTQGIPVTNKYAPDGYYQRLHEVEFTTSIVGGALHDKDMNNVDTGYSSVDFYEDIAGVETLMVNPTQNDLDTKCIRTDFKWMPDVNYMVMSGVVTHQEVPLSEVYMWGVMLDVDPSLNASGIFPIEVLGGGLAMSFVDPRKPVGLKGVNGTLLYYSGVNTPSGFIALPPGLGTNRIRYIMRHQAGFQHRFQSIFEIFRA